MSAGQSALYEYIVQDIIQATKTIHICNLDTLHYEIVLHKKMSESGKLFCFSKSICNIHIQEK